MYDYSCIFLLKSFTHQQSRKNSYTIFQLYEKRHHFHWKKKEKEKRKWDPCE